MKLKLKKVSIISLCLMIFIVFSMPMTAFATEDERGGNEAIKLKNAKDIQLLTEKSNNHNISKNEVITSSKILSSVAIPANAIKEISVNSNGNLVYKVNLKSNIYSYITIKNCGSKHVLVFEENGKIDQVTLNTADGSVFINNEQVRVEKHEGISIANSDKLAAAGKWKQIRYREDRFHWTKDTGFAALYAVVAVATASSLPVAALAAVVSVVYSNGIGWYSFKQYLYNYSKSPQYLKCVIKIYKGYNFNSLKRTITKYYYA